MMSLRREQNRVIDTQQPDTLPLHHHRPDQLLRLLDTSRTSIMVFDAEDNCLFANQAALNLFGASQSQELRSPASPGISPPLQPDGRCSAEKWLEFVQQAQIQSSLSFEWELSRQDGTVMCTRISLTSTPEEGLLHCAIDDISDLKLAQARLQFLDHHDPVISLPNRCRALEKLGQRIDLHDKPACIGVISLELTGFRDFNDAYGYSMGDLKPASPAIMPDATDSVTFSMKRA